MDTIKKFATYILYFGCLICGVIFSLDTIIQFLSFKTNFRTRREPLLLKDAPVIAICYPKGDESPKVEGKVTGRVGGKNKGLLYSSLVEISITDILIRDHRAAKKSCMKIALNSKENETIKVNLSDRRGLWHNLFRLQLLITQPKGWLDKVQLEVFLTSKENFYGIGRGYWYDGEVASGIYSLGQYRIGIRITHAIQTNFILDCTKESYYESMVNEYISTSLTNYISSYRARLPNGTYERINCNYRELCLPFSLPSDIPLCNISTPELERETKCCHYGAFMEMERRKRVNAHNNGYAKYKSCTKMEYQYVLGYSRELMNSSKNNMRFVFEFQASRSLSDGWSLSVQKTIREEYYIMDPITFIGVLGGTVGMFVGLSFFDLSSRIVGLLFMLITYTRKQKKAKINQI